eukprot:3760360-Rhodomonas_salina.2
MEKEGAFNSGSPEMKEVVAGAASRVSKGGGRGREKEGACNDGSPEMNEVVAGAASGGKVQRTAGSSSSHGEAAAGTGRKRKGEGDSLRRLEPRDEGSSLTVAGAASGAKGAEDSRRWRQQQWSSSWHRVNSKVSKEGGRGREKERACDGGSPEMKEVVAGAA